MGCINVCNCNVTLANTGTACMPIMQVARKLLFVPTFKADGTRNGIDLTDTIDSDFFNTWVNEADSFDRLYPLPLMKNITDSRADDVREQFNDGTYAKIMDGVRTFVGSIIGKDATPVLKGKISAFNCSPTSVYIVDKNGSIYGSYDSTEQFLYPIAVDSDSISAKLIQPTDTTIVKLEVSFQFAIEENDACIRMITASELGGSYLLNVNGLKDANMIFSDISQTGVTVKIETEYGSALTKVPVTGLVVTDFISSVGGATSKVYNATDMADVTVSGVTETTDGTYELTFSSQTVADVITVLATKAGYSFTASNFTIA